MNKQEKLLIIVESPNKVKTISSIVKKEGYINTLVTASVGHIMELGDGGSAFNSGITPENNFKMNLKVSSDKKKIADDISQLAKNVDKIILMQDGDREGELIAWSLIKFCKLKKEKCFRAITHEITTKAVINAIENTVPFNDNLVNAGLSRMMTDKLIGYGLSPLARKYIGAKSIGRCQSVGLKLVADRENEILNFIPELYYNLYLHFSKNNTIFKAKYLGYNKEIIQKFTNKKDVDAVVNDCKNSPYVIENIEHINHKESPKQPFCTATFQQEAANRLGLKVKDAMSCAQKLFEGININGEHVGLITYMRTDSTEISKEFLPELEAFVVKTYGKNYYNGPRKSKKKTSDQNGHEALRITDPSLTPELLATYINNNLLLKVYKLIWQRTIASVMISASISETAYIINNKNHKFSFSSKEITNAGYKLAYEFEDASVSSFKETFLIDEELQDTELEVSKEFTRPKSRFTEASLVKELQQLEIGRPSTYATIVETILSPNRGYAKLDEKNIVPTDRGIQLAEYCDRSFPTLINLKYTKSMEESLDRIASGALSWSDYMEEFYNNLKDIIDNTTETGISSDMPEKICPNCGSPMVIRRSRFGKLFYGCSTYPKCNGILNIY